MPYALRPFARLAAGVTLLLVYTALRLPVLDALPLHNDEGLHLTRAVEVLNGHPFWEISDGKIINHWLIAALYPLNAPVYAGRLPTLLVGLIGLAAAYALAYRLGGMPAALCACSLWIGSPYLLFYERTALSDAQAGALVMATLWLAWRLAESGALRDALLTGAVLATAALFKLTAAPFALMVALVVLFGASYSLWRRAMLLVIVTAVVLLAFAVPVVYLVWRGDGFGIAVGWVAGSGTAMLNNLQVNVPRFVGLLFGFGSAAWALLLIGDVVLILSGIPRTSARNALRVLLIATLAPCAAILVMGADPMPRHFVVMLPALLALAGAGLGIALARLSRYAVWAAVAVLVVGLIPFLSALYSDPARLPLPELTRYQFITAHSSGYGLREAMRALPSLVEPPEAPVVGSMFPDSCRRANFYAAAGSPRLLCTDAPGESLIDSLLESQSIVYVLAEAPPIGFVPSEAQRAEQLAEYPRPDSTETITLWRLTAR